MHQTARIFLNPMPDSTLPSRAPTGVRLAWPAKHAREPDARTLSTWPTPPPGANLLIHADNFEALAWMHRHADRVGRVNCCVIDPPYASQVEHGVRAGGRDTVAYSDHWTDEAYCQAMFERAHAIHRVLAPTGFIFVQCDWRANAWWRLILDEVFGRACFRNEIQWRRAPVLGRQAASKQLGRTLDSIFVYSKQPATKFPGHLPTMLKPLPVSRRGVPQGAKWDERAQCWFTTAPRGDYTDASIAKLRKAGRIYESRTGTIAIKYPLVQNDAGVWCKPTPLDTLWDDPGVRPLRHASRRELAIEYVTQKPESLLTRIIAWATRPGDLVLDCFCGSGTTLAAAHALQRRWIGCDVGELAIEVTRRRMRELGANWTDIVPAENAATSHHSPRSPRVTRRKVRATKRTS